MTNDNTTASFEMIDRKALEFAIALVASGDKQKIRKLSKESMKLAKAWHDDQDFRKSWYVRESLTEADWVQINYDSDYDLNDFEVEQEYWIIRVGEHPDGGEHPEKAVFMKIDTRNERQQPFFQLSFNPYNPFPIKAYLPIEIGSQLSDETAPNHPTESKKTYRAFALDVNL